MRGAPNRKKLRLYEKRGRGHDKIPLFKMSQKVIIKPMTTCTVFLLANESYVKKKTSRLIKKSKANIVGYEFAKSIKHNVKCSPKMRENMAKFDQTQSDESDK